MEYSQYYNLSKERKEIWLDNKKYMYDSIMTKRRNDKLCEERDNLHVFYFNYSSSFPWYL